MTLAARSEPHQRQTYRDNIQMVAQQTQSRLRATVTEVPASGEAMSASDLVGSVEARENIGADRTNFENPPNNSRRWLIRPNEVESGQYIDTIEKLDRAMDPTSIYVRTHTSAVQRAWADRILGVSYVSKGNFKLRDGGILGAAVEGKSPGGTKTSLPTKCYTAAGGSGLTLDKLIAAKERLAIDDFGLEDDDEMFKAISPKQVTNLLAIASATGTNLNQFDIDQLKTGKPTTLVGITWIVTNRLPLDSNGDRLCPMWAKNNIVAGVWQDVTGWMENDPHAKNTPYAHVGAYVDVCRVEDNGVHVTRCVES